MKKVASIFAVTVFTLSIFASQLANSSTISTNIENTLACGDCDNPIDDDRGN